MTVDAVVALVRGPVGSQVTLVVRHGPEKSATEHTFQIAHAEIQTPSVEWRRLTETKDGGRGLSAADAL